LVQDALVQLPPLVIDFFLKKFDHLLVWLNIVLPEIGVFTFNLELYCTMKKVSKGYQTLEICCKMEG
jgi:hypothetical protein